MSSTMTTVAKTLIAATGIKQGDIVNIYATPNGSISVHIFAPKGAMMNMFRTVLGRLGFKPDELEHPVIRAIGNKGEFKFYKLELLRNDLVKSYVDPDGTANTWFKISVCAFQPSATWLAGFTIYIKNRYEDYSTLRYLQDNKFVPALDSARRCSNITKRQKLVKSKISIH